MLKINRKSLTLVEVVVAMVILVSVIAGLLSVFTASRRFTMHSKYRLCAVNIARETLESLKADIRSDTWDTGRLKDSADAWVALPQVIVGSVAYTPEYKVAKVIEGGQELGFRKVTARVRWTPLS